MMIVESQRSLLHGLEWKIRIQEETMGISDIKWKLQLDDLRPVDANHPHYPSET